jgi:hypothetical protein
MVTSQEMREFALECLRWSEETDDPSQRDIMVGLARSWMNAARKIDQHVALGGKVFKDLRRKLD